MRRKRNENRKSKRDIQSNLKIMKSRLKKETKQTKQGWHKFKKTNKKSTKKH